MNTAKAPLFCVAALVVLASLLVPASGVAAATLSLDLRCVGSGLRTAPGEPNDHDLLERKTDDDFAPDCIDPLSDAANAFIAVVRDQDGQPKKGVKVAFSFGQRTNGNVAGANDSTNDATLSTDEGPKISTNPGTLQTYCVTGKTGRCKAVLENPVPQSGDEIVVEGAIARSFSARARDTATERWETGVVNGGGVLRLTPNSPTRQIGTQVTLTARLTNQFGQPVQGGNVDFQITAGPHAGWSQTDAVTNADGIAIFTYTGNTAGTDNVQACSETGGTENDTCSAGEPFDISQVNWTT